MGNKKKNVTSTLQPVNNDALIVCIVYEKFFRCTHNYRGKILSEKSFPERMTENFRLELMKQNK